MTIALVTGSAGLIGSQAAEHFAGLGLHVVGVDNDMRKVFFGDESSTAWMATALEQKLGDSYTHESLDIRDRPAVERLFEQYGTDIGIVIHTAAQPSHDWAARDPFTDFDVNAVGTLNMIENTRQHCPDAVFIFTSTNKVYGDTPNRLPLNELETRWEIDPSHPYNDGIEEDMSIDMTKHSLFGASKVAADVVVQEYGRYFGMKTSCFRGGTLTGPNHSAAELHGFLAYVMQCTMTGTPYRVFGYKGKQVRDAIHSSDLINCFEQVYHAPRSAEVYNIGGGRFSNCSVQEAIAMCEDITGKRLDHTYVEDNRIGDHIWWIGSNARFREHYPEWSLKYDVRAILEEMFEANKERWA
ncbi:MAG: NAD-dependent epimerase/dehydratase family protein [Ilumatobacter sp.]|uniref:NAD-dependent epimerase/dehydratase family protein n=1 Tax=Ilumatobacter sp. TaxID=1967498 RepID=UPI00329904C1